MSKSQIACSINATECTVIRLKTSGSTGYILSTCKTLPSGLGDLAAGKGKRILNKLERHLKEWHNDDLALCIEPETYLPLPAYFPADASNDDCEKYCRIEAGYFLTKPEKFRCDHTVYRDNISSGSHKKHLLLFYPDEHFGTVSEHFSVNHRIVFFGSPQLPLLYLSKLTGERQVIIELENNYVLLTIASNGLIEKFSFHRVKNREEREYFTIKELVDNPVCRETGVQVTGAMADKIMLARIGRETSTVLKTLGMPPTIFISNPHNFSISSASAVRAISTALMALTENEGTISF
ncbi:MAG: hypothetical protein HKK66_01060 [Chlorobiaceae bacterium]|nr:hypothetical protein [Chlorobiaceae bacterium]